MNILCNHFQTECRIIIGLCKLQIGSESGFRQKEARDKLSKFLLLNIDEFLLS